MESLPPIAGPATIEPMDTAPAFLPSALQEADRFGWLLYADKMALGEGKWTEVAKRVQHRHAEER